MSPHPDGGRTDRRLRKMGLGKAAKGEFPNAKPESEWKSELSGTEYRMLRQQGTEAPGRGECEFLSTILLP